MLILALILAGPFGLTLGVLGLPGGPAGLIAALGLGLATLGWAIPALEGRSASTLAAQRRTRGLAVPGTARSPVRGAQGPLRP